MNLRKSLAIAVSLTFMVALLAACAGTEGGTTEAPAAAATVETPAETAQQAAAAVEAADFDFSTPSTVFRGEVNQQTYPLVLERITLTYWLPIAGAMGEVTDLNDTEFWQWYEELTNVHIDFIIPPAGGERDAFNLLFAAGDLPDMIHANTHAGHVYRGGEDRAIDDGWFIDMVDFMEYAPNYWSWISHTEDRGFNPAVFSDLGKIAGFWALWIPMYEELGVMPEYGMAIRQDFLDQVGLGIPTTFDEWETMLIAFRDELDIEAPLYTSRYGTFGIRGDFMAGFQTAPWFYQIDGVVRFGPLDDGYRDYLALKHRWYDMGLLDRDFPTRSTAGITADNDMILNDRIGAHMDWATRMSATYVARGASNEDFFLVAAPQPMLTPDGPFPNYRAVTGPNDMTGRLGLVSASSNHIETAVRWFDGFFARDIYLNANFGLDHEEGRVWHHTPDGRRIGDYDFRFSNPDGLSPATVIVQYWTREPFVRVESAQYEQSPENNRLSYRVWGTFGADWVLPERITLTPEEASRFNAIYSDIETFVQEHNVRFITGSIPMSEFDTFRDTLISMGIEEAISIQQAGLDRYRNR